MVFEAPCVGYKVIVDFYKIEPGFQGLLQFESAFKHHFDEQPNASRETVSGIYTIFDRLFIHFSSCANLLFLAWSAHNDYPEVIFS